MKASRHRKAKARHQAPSSPPPPEPKAEQVDEAEAREARRQAFKEKFRHMVNDIATSACEEIAERFPKYLQFYAAEAVANQLSYSVCTSAAELRFESERKAAENGG